MAPTRPDTVTVFNPGPDIYTWSGGVIGRYDTAGVPAGHPAILAALTAGTLTTALLPDPTLTPEV